MNAECKKLAKYVEDFINCMPATSRLESPHDNRWNEGYHTGVLMLAEKVFNLQLDVSTRKYKVLDMKSSLIS